MNYYRKCYYNNSFLFRVQDFGICVNLDVVASVVLKHTEAFPFFL